MNKDNSNKGIQGTGHSSANSTHIVHQGPEIREEMPRSSNTPPPPKPSNK